MAEVNMKAAKAVYNALIEMLDGLDWKYQRYDEDLVISCTAHGKDIPIEFIMAVRPKLEIVQFLSQLPSKVPEDKRVDFAIAICIANNSLANGSFDLDIHTGKITFKVANSYRDSTIGKGTLEYLMLGGLGVVDAYNDKFYMLAKNVMTLQQFIEQEKS